MFCNVQILFQIVLFIFCSTFFYSNYYSCLFSARFLWQLVCHPHSIWPSFISVLFGHLLIHRSFIRNMTNGKPNLFNEYFQTIFIREIFITKLNHAPHLSSKNSHMDRCAPKFRFTASDPGLPNIIVSFEAVAREKMLISGRVNSQYVVIPFQYYADGQGKANDFSLFYIFSILKQNHHVELFFSSYTLEGTWSVANAVYHFTPLVHDSHLLHYIEYYSNAPR